MSERGGGVSGPRSGQRRGRRGSAPMPRSGRRQGSDSPGRRGAWGPGQALNSPTPLLVWATWRGPTCVDLLGGKVGPSQQAHALALQRTSLGAAHYPLAPRTATLMVLTLLPVTAPKPPATLPPPRVRLTRRVRTKAMPTPAAQAPTLLHLPWARIVLTQTLPLGTRPCGARVALLPHQPAWWACPLAEAYRPLAASTRRRSSHGPCHLPAEQLSSHPSAPSHPDYWPFARERSALTLNGLPHAVPLPQWMTWRGLARATLQELEVLPARQVLATGPRGLTLAIRAPASASATSPPRSEPA